MYLHDHNKSMPTPAVAQMLSTMMYNKRFFPYYVSNILAGLDNEGKGAVYSYDPIGHFARSDFRATGSSGALLQSLLDNQVSFTLLIRYYLILTYRTDFLLAYSTNFLTQICIFTYQTY